MKKNGLKSLTAVHQKTTGNQPTEIKRKTKNQQKNPYFFNNYI